MEQKIAVNKILNLSEYAQKYYEKDPRKSKELHNPDIETHKEWPEPSGTVGLTRSCIYHPPNWTPRGREEKMGLKILTSNRTTSPDIRGCRRFKTLLNPRA